MPAKNLEKLLLAHANEFHAVVPFVKGDKLLLLDFTDNNQELNAEIIENTNVFIQYINSKLQVAGAKYGIGGYAEHRTIYLKVEDGAKAPSRSEGDNQSELILTDLKKQEEKNSFSKLSSPPIGGG